MSATPETVDHPAHYLSGGMEVIDVIEAFRLGFHAGNAVKYILRAVVGPFEHLNFSR